MDDEIIYSWCFNFVECFDSTSSAAIVVLVETWRACQASDPSMYTHDVPWRIPSLGKKYDKLGIIKNP